MVLPTHIQKSLEEHYEKIGDEKSLKKQRKSMETVRRIREGKKVIGFAPSNFIYKYNFGSKGNDEQIDREVKFNLDMINNRVKIVVKPLLKDGSTFHKKEIQPGFHKKEIQPGEVKIEGLKALDKLDATFLQNALSRVKSIRMSDKGNIVLSLNKL